MDRFSEVSHIFPHFALKSRERDVKSPCFYYVWWALTLFHLFSTTKTKRVLLLFIYNNTLNIKVYFYQHINFVIKSFFLFRKGDFNVTIYVEFITTVWARKYLLIHNKCTVTNYYLMGLGYKTSHYFRGKYFDSFSRYSGSLHQ